MRLFSVPRLKKCAALDNVIHESRKLIEHWCKH
jgi:hypothetical protein